MGKINWGLICLSIVGLGLLAGSYLSYVNTQNFIAKADRAPGEVINLIQVKSDDGYTYKPEVRFSTENGASYTFQSSTSSNPPAFKVGEKVEVLYDPSNPYDAKINAFWSLHLLTIILAFIGVVFTSLTLGTKLYGIFKKNRNDQLKRTGRRIETQLLTVDRNTSLKINGKSPWVVRVQGEDPRGRGEKIFKSDNIWFDPSPYVSDQNITVFVSKENANKYYVDLSFLPKK